MRLQCNGHKRSVWGVGLAAVCAIFFMMSAAAFGQTAVDHFSNPRSSGFLQLVDGAGTINFVRAYYADQGDYEERALITAAGQTAFLKSSINITLTPGMIITTSIFIEGNHSLQIMISPDNGATWKNFTDLSIGGVLSPDYNYYPDWNHGAFVGPINSPLSIDFRQINQAGFPQLRVAFVATAGTVVNSGDRVALTNEMANWESSLNPVNRVHAHFDNSTAIVSVDDNEEGDNPPTVPSYDIRGNIIGIYRSTDGGAFQYQGDTNGYFYQQDVTNTHDVNGVAVPYIYTYAAERRDAYGNKSAQINAAPGQAACNPTDPRPGQTRIVGVNDGGVKFNWFLHQNTEVPCGTPTTIDYYEIYEGDLGQPLSTFSLVDVIAPDSTSWSVGGIPSGNKCWMVIAVKNGIREQDMTP